jgi:uncharacterized zinc-type alcohol dehydrogenase-like protein
LSFSCPQPTDDSGDGSPGRPTHTGATIPFGGYFNVFVVKEDFLLKIPSSLRPEVAAPILCAGVTTYSPLKRWGVKRGQKVSIVGFGGLGHLACKLAQALGTDVTVTHTKEKLDEAAKLGITGSLKRTRRCRNP